MFVVLEGIDGSGKATQANLLYQRAVREGYAAAKLAFPQYGRNPFAEAVAEYLNGDFGGVRDVHPKLASMLYAGDRFAGREAILEALKGNSMVVSDRYVSSNLAHQGAKLLPEARAEFFKWLSAIEYDYFHLPRPDLTIYLDVPVKQAKKLVAAKAPRHQHTLFSEDQDAYTSKAADIHEEDLVYLANCRQCYETLVADDRSSAWQTVRCLDETEQMRSAKNIAEDVWLLVRPGLAGLSPELRKAQ